MCVYYICQVFCTSYDQSDGLLSLLDPVIQPLTALYTFCDTHQHPLSKQARSVLTRYIE